MFAYSFSDQFTFWLVMVCLVGGCVMAAIKKVAGSDFGKGFIEGFLGQMRK
jgi:hypothetical protein